MTIDVMQAIANASWVIPPRDSAEFYDSSRNAYVPPVDTSVLAKQYFPHACDEYAAAQMARLISAKQWMVHRGIVAMIPGSKFTYKVATGSVLGQRG